METPAQLAIQQITTRFTLPAAPLTYASHLLHVIHLVPPAQQPTSQLNVGLASAHTSSKELFASNPVTQDITQTPTVCVKNVLTLAKSAVVHLLPAQLAKLSIICI